MSRWSQTHSASGALLTFVADNAGFFADATLGSLNIQSDEINFAANLTTTASIKFIGPITLLDDVTLTGATIELNEVDAAEGTDASLILVGETTLLSALGSNQPLGHLTAGKLNANDGDVELKANNSFTGDTDAISGDLMVTGAIAGNVLVSDATLSGNGAIAGDVHLGADGLLAPTPHATNVLTIVGDLVFDDEAGFVLRGTDANTLGRVQADSVEWFRTNHHSRNIASNKSDSAIE